MPQHNSGAPSVDGYIDIPAIATTAVPSYTEGNAVMLSVDLAGALRTVGSGTTTVSISQTGTSNDVDIASALPAGTNNIGDVDIITIPNITIGSAIPAGTNNIGDVDVLTLPSIPAGTNNIGDVDVLTLPALAAGTANIGDVDVLTIAAGDNNIGNVDVVTLPALVAGTANIGDVDVLTLPALPTGSNTIGAVSQNGTWTVQPGNTANTTAWLVTQGGTTNTNSVVVVSVSNITLLASNGSRKSATIYNNSPYRMFVKLGATAAIDDYTEILNPRSRYDVPGYTGIIDGLWDAPLSDQWINGFSNLVGNARVSEVT